LHPEFDSLEPVVKIHQRLSRSCVLAMGLSGLTCAAIASDTSLISGLEQTIRWNHPDDFFAESVLRLAYSTTVKPEALIIRRATQAGMDYWVTFEALGTASRLPVEFDGACIEGNRDVSGGGEVAQGCFVQAGAHDFNADGLPEIIIALGDGWRHLEINVFSYHPPAHSSDAIRAENWALIGHFSGQSKATIADQSIALAFGSQGLEQKLLFVDGRFMELVPR